MDRIMKRSPRLALWLALLCAALVVSAPAQDQKAPKKIKAKAEQQAPKAARPQPNYDESKMGDFTLPDPLKMSDGTPVTSAEQWMQSRRPELLRLFQVEEYGRPPKPVDDLKFEVTSEKKDALGGKATRKIVHIWLEKHPGWDGMDLMVYTPNEAKGPVPAFVGLSFGGNQAASTETDVPLPRNFEKKFRAGRAQVDPESTRGKEATGWPIEMMIGRGYAVATAWYCDIEPDREGGWELGVRAALTKDGPDADWNVERDWSAIGAWAWGLSRAMDYLETEKAIDAKKVAVLGHSRLAKTSTWAGASDERFAIVISNDSGEGGAALARRNIGETIASMQISFPYWFCQKHWSWVGKVNEMPIDQHELIALAAPRPVYVASASEDQWADPKGEFLAAKAAEPVYALFGMKGLGVAEWPKADQPVGDCIAYHLRTGKHAITEYDWTQYANFADRHFGRK